jgi:hypothetical protein
MRQSITHDSHNGGDGNGSSSHYDYSKSLNDEEGEALPPYFDGSIHVDKALPPALTVEQAREAGRTEILRDFSRMNQSSKHLFVTEDSGLIPQLIYSKLDIETDKHPFFKRMWIIRHRLDATTPLLSTEARDMINANGGFWPTELNDYKEVRKHLKFNEMMVTLSGTDHITGNTVYSHKAYDYVDVNIGWRFANALVVDPKTQALGVDLSLMNDVLEQHGGGAEPFTDVIEGDAAALDDNDRNYATHVEKDDRIKEDYQQRERSSIKIDGFQQISQDRMQQRLADVARFFIEYFFLVNRTLLLWETIRGFIYLCISLFESTLAPRWKHIGRDYCACFRCAHALLFLAAHT